MEREVAQCLSCLTRFHDAQSEQRGPASLAVCAFPPCQLTNYTAVFSAAIMDVFGGGQGNAFGQNPIEQWFYETPVITRWWTVANVVLGVLVTCNIVSPFQLFYSFRAVFMRDQYWRLITAFLYHSPLGMDLLFHVFFMQRYSRLLEESSGRSAALFSWLLLYAMVSLLALSAFLDDTFLGHGLSQTLVYIWARRNPDARMSFLGVLNFTAPFLPFVLLGLSYVLNGKLPWEDVLGIVVGHVYYFLADVYPAIWPGSHPMDPPQWWYALFGERNPNQRSGQFVPVEQALQEEEEE